MKSKTSFGETSLGADRTRPSESRTVEKSSLARKLSSISGGARTSEIEELLNSLPQAALLIDSNTWIIIHANPRTSEYTQYTHFELEGIDARKLFGDWGEDERITGSNHNSSEQAQFKRLIRRDQSQMTFRVLMSPVKNNDRHTLLILEPAESLPDPNEREACSGSISSPFWLSLNEFIEAEKEADLQTALNRALAAAAALSGGDTLVIYRLMDGIPEIQRLAGYGDIHLLPGSLNMQDLISLNKARVWQTGKRPFCNLYRSARASGVRYVASAPIGQNTAIIGLALIAGKSSGLPAFALESVRMLARVVESIFENHMNRANLLQNLGEQTYRSKRLAAISEKVQEGVIQLSPELEVRGMNPRAEQIFGYSLREVMGKTVDKIIIGDELLSAAFLQAQTGQDVYNLGDIRIFRRNGESFQALVRVFSVIIDRKMDEILVFIQDLSELERIRSQNQVLENRALLGELMAVFAHEVRNPINNISTGLQLMSMNLAPEDSQQAPITRMLQDCDRLANLIKSVLAFSKPQEYEMAPLDIGLLLQRLLDRLRPRISQPNILCDLQVDPGIPPISGNLRSLEQVFNNLINNAIQAMGEKGGVLSLKVQSYLGEEEIQYVDVYVTDTGPGIPKEMQDQIYQPFFTTKPSGTGLGLPIAKRILAAHKGNIQVSSFPGGTIFQIRLPAISEQDTTGEMYHV